MTAWFEVVKDDVSISKLIQMSICSGLRGSHRLAWCYGGFPSKSWDRA